MLLAGAGGLPPEQANIILSNLAASTPTAIDGTLPGGVYPQRFGIPEGLYAEPVAVKQGWMCCDRRRLDAPVHRRHRTGPPLCHGDRLHAARRDVTARNTITQAVKTMFPGGRV